MTAPDVFGWMVDACVPLGGSVVIFGEVYVDESGTHEGSPMLTVGGYLFDRDQARKFSRDWASDLASIPLPCAHMTDCANGNGDYAALEMEDRIRSEKLLIENIKRRSRFGFGVSVDPAAYARIVGSEKNAPSAYTYALQSCFVILGPRELSSGARSLTFSRLDTLRRQRLIDTFQMHCSRVTHQRPKISMPATRFWTRSRPFHSRRQICWRGSFSTTTPA